MTNTAMSNLTSVGHNLDLDDSAFGPLLDSSAIADDFAALRARMRAEGYLYLRGYLDRGEVVAARRVILAGLERENLLLAGSATDEAIARPNADVTFRPDLAQRNAALHKVLYDGAMMDFWNHFFEEATRHFDFTWLRVVAPGRGTAPHCDVVYMGRGTHELYTAWTPLSDISLEMGGLMILEKSHCHAKLNANYGQKDVDAFCENRRPDWKEMGGGGNIRGGGALSHNPVKLRENLGGRWLTTEFEMGDVLLFSVNTVHASLDNASDRIRLSSDSRYQRASQPADERWIGANPIGHGPQAKRALIC
jgi:hypothetical protein